MNATIEAQPQAPAAPLPEWIIDRQEEMGIGNYMILGDVVYPRVAAELGYSEPYSKYERAMIRFVVKNDARIAILGSKAQRPRPDGTPAPAIIQHIVFTDKDRWAVDLARDERGGDKRAAAVDQAVEAGVPREAAERLVPSLDMAAYRNEARQKYAALRGYMPV